MSFNDALKILGLNENYTEQELKKAYKLAAKKYHPDVNPGISDSKMQQVNSAHELLKNHLKSGSNKYRSNEYGRSINVEYERCKFMGKISVYIVNSRECRTELNRKVNALIKKYLNYFKFIIDGDGIESINYMNNLYDEFEKKVHEMYRVEKEEYFKMNKMSADFNFIFDYVCNSNEFYEQLKLAKQEYSRKLQDKAKAELGVLLSKYQFWAGYDKVESKLLLELEDVLFALSHDFSFDYKEAYSQKARFAFDMYYKNLAKFNCIKDKYKDFGDSEVQLLISDLDQHLCDSEFDRIYSSFIFWQKVKNKGQTEMEEKVIKQNISSLPIINKKLKDDVDIISEIMDESANSNIYNKIRVKRL